MLNVTNLFPIPIMMKVIGQFVGMTTPKGFRDHMSFNSPSTWRIIIYHHTLLPCCFFIAWFDSIGVTKFEQIVVKLFWVACVAI